MGMVSHLNTPAGARFHFYTNPVANVTG